jgi:hypothetical protein
LNLLILCVFTPNSKENQKNNCLENKTSFKTFAKYPISLEMHSIVLLQSNVLHGKTNASIAFLGLIFERVEGWVIQVYSFNLF